MFVLLFSLKYNALSCLIALLFLIQTKLADCSCLLMLNTITCLKLQLLIYSI